VEVGDDKGHIGGFCATIAAMLLPKVKLLGNFSPEILLYSPRF
jgi:hypothetical protein